MFPYSVLCRILSNVGSSFYITPTEKSVEIATKISFNSSNFDVNMNIPVLTYWNKGKFWSKYTKKLIVIDIGHDTCNKFFDTYLFVEKEQWISVEEKCHRSNVTQSQIISTVVCRIYVFTQNV